MPNSDEPSMSHVNLDTLKKLYVDQLRYLYSGEKQLEKLLPQMLHFASSKELGAILKDHLSETQLHIKRLDEIFTELGVSNNGRFCSGMRGIVEEVRELMKLGGHPVILDAALVTLTQRLEHYEIAGYGCVRVYAEFLGEIQAAKLLQEILDEELESNQALSDLALFSINREALRLKESSYA
jgi:ferritin-like metal-binding protein YciE